MKFIGDFDRTLEDYITTLPAVTSIGKDTGQLSITANEVYLYDATNDGNPTISLGSTANERLEIKAQYESGAQGLDVVKFTTYTAGGSANDGRYSFFVDEVSLFQIKDAGINIPQSLNLSIGGVDILTDSSGTTTLNNIDALDSTTIATMEAAMESNLDTLNSVTSASSLATVGTIGTGVWNGTAIGIEYTVAKVTSIVAGDGIDVSGATEDVTITAETASASNPGIVELATTAETLTGTDTGRAVTPDGLKDSGYVNNSAQRQLTHHMFQDDINTDKIYIGLQETDAESATATNKNLPLLAPVAGKLLKIFVRANSNVSSIDYTWRLELRTTSESTSGTPSGTFGTQSGNGPTNSSMVTYDFTSSLDAGSNAIAVGDTVQLSVQADSDPGGNIKYYVTCLWEWDLS